MHRKSELVFTVTPELIFNTLHVSHVTIFTDPITPLFARRKQANRAKTSSRLL